MNFLKEGKIRVYSIVKFLNLCSFTIQKLKRPTIEEIMDVNHCSRSNAYNYQRALRYLYPEELLEQLREKREDKSVQQELD